MTWAKYKLSPLETGTIECHFENKRAELLNLFVSYEMSIIPWRDTGKHRPQRGPPVDGYLFDLFVQHLIDVSAVHRSNRLQNIDEFIFPDTYIHCVCMCYQFLYVILLLVLYICIQIFFISKIQELHDRKICKHMPITCKSFIQVSYLHDKIFLERQQVNWNYIRCFKLM